MTDMTSNPLVAHFRQPAIYITLPSKGSFWPDGSLVVPLNGELAILPMTARDEITIKTPDALLNGSSVVNVIQSCCPNVRDAWQMPNIDIDTLLIAIRIASYGHELPIETTCPHCNEPNSHEIDLRGLLDNQTSPDFNKIYVDKDSKLRFKLRPQAYFNANQVSQIRFEQEKAMSVINDPDLDETAKKTIFDKHVHKIIDISMSSLAANTESITMEDGNTVTNSEFIKQYYLNTNGSSIKGVQAHLASIMEEVAIKPFKLQCGECTKPYESAFTFDYANFFDSGF